MRAIYVVKDSSGNEYQTFARTSNAIASIKAKASREFRRPIVAVISEHPYGTVTGRKKKAHLG